MGCPKRLFDRCGAAVEHVAGKVRKNRLESYKPAVKINLTDPDLYSHGDPYAPWRWLREHEAGKLASLQGSSGFLHAEIRDIAREVVSCSRTLIDGRR
jgi:hypothetical protein